MKRPLFIIIGALVVLILVAIWVYMLFFGSPKNANDKFTDLNFGDTTDITYVDNGEVGKEEPVIDFTSPDRLRQLTTKPVIGFQEYAVDASSTPKIIYAEAGTGHVFSIDTETGEEVRLSGTTIPSSQVAEISPNGKYIMYQSGDSGASRHLVGSFSSSSSDLVTTTIDESILNFSATVDNSFLFAVKTPNATIGKVYNPADQSTKTLFTIPFRDATIDWGNSANSSHFAYPKATSQLESFLFKIDGTKIKRLPIDGYGMSASGDSSFVIFSKQQDSKYQTFIHNIITDSTEKFNLTLIPEKCNFSISDSKLSICAQSYVNYGNDMPDIWYAGVTSFADSLWEIDETGSATLLSDTESESGRELDIINIELGTNNHNIYFINKNDKTLWLYERVQILENSTN